MSYLEYSDELYEAWDKVNNAVWYYVVCRIK